MNMSKFKRALVTLNCMRYARDHRWDVKLGAAPDWINENLAYWESRVEELRAAERAGKADEPQRDLVLGDLIRLEARLGRHTHDVPRTCTTGKTGPPIFEQETNDEHDRA